MRVSSALLRYRAKISRLVTVEVFKGEDTGKVLQDIKNAVDKISSFPANSERPVIFEQKFRSQVLSILLYGEPDLFNLRHMAEVMRDQLLDIEGISQVTLTGVPDIEFSIEVNEETLRRYRMTFQEIASAVAAANVNISGGKVETPSEEMLIRSWGRRYHAHELHDIPVRGNTDGTVIRLGDVAVPDRALAGYTRPHLLRRPQCRHAGHRKDQAGGYPRDRPDAPRP